VVFISHKLSEVFEITDRVAVLRDGRNAGEVDAKTGTIEELINRMVAGTWALAPPAWAAPSPAPRCSGGGLCGPPW